MKKCLIVVISGIIIALLGIPSCSPQINGINQQQSVSVDYVVSEKTQTNISEISNAEKQGITQGNGTFAIDLYHQLKNSDENLFFSPYSISSALAMTYAGANGTTAEQMASALHFDLPDEQLHSAFNWLNTELSKRGAGAKGKDGEAFRLNIVNNLWGQKNYEFRDSFLDTLAENYGAGLRVLDYINEPEKSRVTINDWISEQTENRINNLIPAGCIDPSTRLILTNAVYFNAAWQDEFSDDSVQDLTFFPLSGPDIQVPMMCQSNTYSYVDGDGYQAVTLPYDGKELSMMIIMPDKGTFYEFENQLNYQQIGSILSNMNYVPLRLTIPKFKLESKYTLSRELAELGMPLAFNSQADFSGITSEKEPFSIGEIIHKTFIEVDTKGTEAAAATAVIMVTSAPESTGPVTVTINCPYIFIIRDIKTNTILFMGRILNPQL